MLARIIHDLSGLNIDEEYETDADDEAQGLLTAATYARDNREGGGREEPQWATAPLPQPDAPAFATPARPARTDTTTPQSSGGDSTRSSSGKWKSFLGATKTLLDNLIPDLGDSDSDTGDRPQRRPPPGPALRTSGYPAVSETRQEDAAPPEGNATPPTPLQVLPDEPIPDMSEPSALMEEEHVRGLNAEVPTRYRQCRWTLLYSTQRDGISMQTLLRNGRNKSPTVLVVRDMNRHVFGAYCSEPWRQAPRYYGTGETFVFRLRPQTGVWHWWWRKMAHTQNDFFMWGEKGAIAVGGAGGYALWLDEELSRGLSRNSITFGNDSLASAEEFRIGAVELWWLA